ncbi:tail fiber domain-containing protein [Limosilactobacillus fermentum]|uniref:tail fiber domain-containing protein n=5 Tax=Limosilactobacillus fermentum TaxID=1613 RepID=UPI003EBF5B21
MNNTSDQTTQQSKTRLIVGEIGVDTETGIIGKGHSYDNGKTFVVDDTIYGRIYHKDDHGRIWKGIQDKVEKVVKPAIDSANSAQSTADAAVASAQVTSDAVTAIASATAEAKQDANEAMSRAKSAWDVATGAKEAVTDFDPLLKSAQSDAKQANETATSAYEQSRSAYDAVKADSSAFVAMQSSMADFQEDVASAQSVADSAKTDAGKALTQIADTNNALSDVKTAFDSGVAEAKELASTAQTTADSAVESAGENAKALASQANALSDAKKAMDSGVASAKGLANAAQATADNAIKSASSVANDLAAVASQAKSNASGITKVTSDVGLLQITVADNSGNISKIQETATKIQQAVSDNSGAIMTATQTAQSAVTVASDAKSNATIAVQTASGASVTAENAQSDATTAMVTASGAVTQASDAKSNATIAVQTASEASVTATNAQGDASVAKQTASDASVQIKNAQGDISKLQTRAGTIEASVSSNSGAIADVQATANQLKASVSDNAGNITVATQTAQSAVAVASDASSNATVATQTASQASITAKNASGQAASAVITANGAMTTASDAKSNATVAVQTASGASLTATNAQSDATIAKQTASEAIVQASNADSDFAQLSIRANKIEANVATNSGAIASVQQTANGLTTTVAKLTARDGINLLQGTSTTDNVGPSDFSGIPVTAGDSYTFSGFMSSTSTSGVIAPYIQFYDGSGTKLKQFAKNSNVPVASGTSFVVTGVAPTNSVTARVLLVSSNGSTTINYRSLKFEHGSQATPWTPAPTDASVAYNSLKVTVDQTSNIINDPKTGLNATYQTATGNATTISNVKSDVAQLETTASGLTSRVGNLESKTNTQQTAIEQNKNAIKFKADQTTVDTLKGTVSQNTATLTTQADEIKNKVTRSDVTGILTGYATQDYTQSLVTQKADEWNVNLTKLKNDTQTSLTQLAVGVEGVQAQVYNSDGSSKITQLSNLIATKVSQDDYNSQITQLKNDINLRVAKGDVISQINQEAGGDTLIQVSNGKKSLILDAGNTIITGKAWIPDAAISSISADKIMLGSSALYNSDGTLNLVNQSNDLKALIQVKQGLVQDTTQSIISFSSDYNNRAFSITPVGATVTPTLFFERYDQTAGHWLGFTRNEVQREGLTFNTWDNEGERFFVSCHARFNKNITAEGIIMQGTWNGTTGKPEAGILSIESGNTIWSGSGFLAVGDHISNSYTNVIAKSFSQQSTLSSKTNIETVDPKDALDLVNRTDIRSYQYKTDVAQGKTKRYTSLIIDDVNDVSQYYAPDEFTNEERTGRDDGSAVGYLFLAVQELTRRIKTLEEKLNG